mmetsp:Transcript_7519/g.15182  ORF Transcript_7519/g.15182 Transcript_7519/m.15182 type:complete len:133 (-) Transcript_7519:244-642(-)|eukprot:CAMPEP_0170364800 /NCGR_PEP_ID=MMETSP0117_2-20130122/5570_1 /TAXON_ID=400756 /ORGANISM="Durinskia baltica, Strain CSIRO CS-38" /LENGTH=132 /DNA_ID=CAMNT_0010619331 /DNA_START=68 /DNA_END=466 /DNA_ORIENTATION=+
MPESGKMIKNRQHAANRAAGIGDADGRLPSRVKAETVVATCTQCMMPIRMSKSNADARLHFENKHPASTFATCFPGQFDPTAVVASAPAASADVKATPVAASTQPKPKAKSQDLSFLDASLASNPVKGKGKK